MVYESPSDNTVGSELDEPQTIHSATDISSITVIRTFGKVDEEDAFMIINPFSQPFPSRTRIGIQPPPILSVRRPNPTGFWSR
jgi:hypothetical protein